MRSIGAIILAAGGSFRLGQPKQLLTFRGETLVQRAVRAATEGGCQPVIVVAGQLAETIRIALDNPESFRPRSSNLPAEPGAARATIVENAQWQSGIGTSIRRGLEQLPKSVQGVVLLTCDQPFVDAQIVARLIAEREKTGKPIVASHYANTHGVPVLFDRSFFDALLRLPDNSGAKSLIEAHPGEIASIEFEAGTVDIDTPNDLDHLERPASLSD